VCVFKFGFYFEKCYIFLFKQQRKNISRAREREKKKETEEWRRIKSVLYIFFPISLVSLTLTF